MNSRELSESDNVVRYVSLTHLQGGKASGSAFRPKETGDDMSVNWLECFEGQVKSEQLSTVRKLIRLGMGTQAKLAELNVGTTIEKFKHDVAKHNGSHNCQVPINCNLQFVKTPLCETVEYQADPSHCDIMTLPPPDLSCLDLIGDFIARNVVSLHPAKLRNNAEPTA